MPSGQAVYLISEMGGGANLVTADIRYLLLFRECDGVKCERVFFYAGTSWHCRKFKWKKSHIFYVREILVVGLAC